MFFYHNSYLKYYLFLIILMTIKRNSIHKSLCPSWLLALSDVADWDGLGIKWVHQWVDWTSGGEIGDGSWGVGEFVELSHQVSLEGVGLFISDPSLVVLVEMSPGVLEVSIQVGWYLMWVKFMGGFEDGTSGNLSIVLHEELLTSFVSGWGESFLGEFGENIVHDLILVGTIVSRNVHFLPSGAIQVSSLWLRVVSDSNGNNSAEQGSDGYSEFHAYLDKYIPH